MDKAVELRRLNAYKERKKLIDGKIKEIESKLYPKVPKKKKEKEDGDG